MLSQGHSWRSRTWSARTSLPPDPTPLMFPRPYWNSPPSPLATQHPLSPALVLDMHHCPLPPQICHQNPQSTWYPHLISWMHSGHYTPTHFFIQHHHHISHISHLAICVIVELDWLHIGDTSSFYSSCHNILMAMLHCTFMPYPYNAFNLQSSLNGLVKF